MPVHWIYQPFFWQPVSFVCIFEKNKTKSCLKNVLWQQKWDEQSLKFSDTVIEKKLRSSSQVAVNDVNINNMLISDKFIYGKKENFEKNDSKSYIG